MSGIVGGAIGGAMAGLNAYFDGKNIWDGEDVQIGRKWFSINNSPSPRNELYYVDANGQLYPIDQFNSNNNREINVRFWNENDNGTFKRFDHELSLESNHKYPSSQVIKMPQNQKIIGNVGIKTGKYYWTGKSVTFTSNNGLTKTLTQPGAFTFSSRGLKIINAVITGTPFNNGSTIAANSFRVIVRIK